MILQTQQPPSPLEQLLEDPVVGIVLVALGIVVIIWCFYVWLRAGLVDDRYLSDKRSRMIHKLIEDPENPPRGWEKDPLELRSDIGENPGLPDTWDEGADPYVNRKV